MPRLTKCAYQISCSRHDPLVVRRLLKTRSYQTAICAVETLRNWTRPLHPATTALPERNSLQHELPQSRPARGRGL